MEFKSKYIGKRIAKGGVSFILSNDLKESEKKFILERFGKEYFVQKRAKKDDSTNEKPTE